MGEPPHRNILDKIQYFFINLKKMWFYPSVGGFTRLFHGFTLEKRGFTAYTGLGVYKNLKRTLGFQRVL